MRVFEFFVDAVVEALTRLDEDAAAAAAAHAERGRNGDEADVESGWERLREAFPRTGEEVRVLLS